MNHGNYFQWWTIQERPVLFGLSALSLSAGVLFLWSSLAWLWWKGWKGRRLAGELREVPLPASDEVAGPSQAAQPNDGYRRRR
jgi:hypothetical protein